MVMQTSVDHEARDFSLFHPETKRLILGVLNKPEAGTDSHVIYLAENLRRSDAVVEAAKRLVVNEPLIIHWSDWLNLLLWDCLKPFHSESYGHLLRVKEIMRNIKDMVDRYGLKGIPDYGNKDFLAIRDKLVISETDWQLLFHAAWYHDLAKMAYPASFWTTPGKFSSLQRKELEAHARLFFFLGEFFHVPDDLTALSVLHHYPNKRYPHNGVVSQLKHHLEDPHFVQLLHFLMHCDVYEGITGERGYQRQRFLHHDALTKMPAELKHIGLAFMSLLQAAKELLFPTESVLCPSRIAS